MTILDVETRPGDALVHVVLRGELDLSTVEKVEEELRRVEGDGFSVIRSLVGHGVGRDMHEDPQIPNYGRPDTGPTLEEGMVLAIEPMVNAGGHEVRMGTDNWAVYSLDGSLAAHFEHTVAITAEGPRILTPWHDEGDAVRPAGTADAASASAA